MNAFVKFVASAGVGPLVTWLGNFVGLLEKTLVIRAGADAAISYTAIKAGAVIAVVLVLLFFRAKKPILVGGALFFLFLALVAAVMIGSLYHELESSMPRLSRQDLEGRYDVYSIVCLASVTQALTFALLYAFNKLPRQRR